VFEAGAVRGRLVPRDVRIEAIETPGVRGELLVAAGAAPERAILYAHGGAYVACSPMTHRSLTISLARASGAPVFAVDYRRAPEHRFPSALDDVMAGYDLLCARGFPAQGIVIAGDSAGGALALSTIFALRARDAAAALPAGVVAFSPWSDALGTGMSVYENALADDMLDPVLGTILARLYAEPAELRDPLVSPLYGDYAGFPPIALFVGSTEILRDDSLRLAERARAAGVGVTLHVEDALPHVWPIFEFLPESKRTMRLVADFVQRVWARGATAREGPERRSVPVAARG
jgi:acetyl esterase/lipase